jgi:putative transcriptional regulator
VNQQTLENVRVPPQMRPSHSPGIVAMREAFARSTPRACGATAGHSSYKVEAMPLPKVDSKLIRDTRKRLHCSRAVLARRLRINERTLEKWEQGRAKPNPQAAALVLLVRSFPDTLERLERVDAG